MDLEKYLDEEFRLLKVEPHIMHIRAHTGGRELPSAVTLATVDPLNIKTVGLVLFHLETIYYGDEDLQKTRSLASFMKQRLEEDGCAGVAVCDYRDQFSRKRGRIIAKGRLFKLLRKVRRRER